MTHLDANRARGSVSGPRGITAAKLKAALRRHAGVYSLAAHELGVSRQAVFDRVRRSSDLQRFVHEIQETLLDAVDAGIADLIVNKRDPTTLRWYADRKGRQRGYGTAPVDDVYETSRSAVTVVIEYVDANHGEHAEDSLPR